MATIIKWLWATILKGNRTYLVMLATNHYGYGTYSIMWASIHDGNRTWFTILNGNGTYLVIWATIHNGYGIHQIIIHIHKA